MNAFSYVVGVNQTVIVWLSLILSIIGISALFFLSPDVSPQYLLMNGAVTGVDRRGRVTFISFIPEDFGVISFKDLQVPAGNVSLVGRLNQYKGRVEFVVESVR